MNKNNMMFGKSKEEIYFQWTLKRKLPRLICNYAFSSSEERRRLRSMPHLFRCRYRGSVIEEISREDVDEQTLKTWAELSFYPEEKFDALLEFYDPVSKIMIDMNLPMISKEPTKRTL